VLSDVDVFVKVEIFDALPFQGYKLSSPVSVNWLLKQDTFKDRSKCTVCHLRFRIADVSEEPATFYPEDRDVRFF
jgi:hypothetical protein